MFERYTEKARRVIFYARYEASRLGGAAITPEHLLLGLMREDESLLKYLLSKNGKASTEDLRREVEKRVPSAESVSQKTELPLASETKHVLVFAHEESEDLRHRHIGTEHLLLGLLREKSSIAATVLGEHGLKSDAVREEIKRIGHYD
ncbi:MAG: hypothetical protein NVSMB56_14560 [Pyrinomonadaceae bacterium]